MVEERHLSDGAGAGGPTGAQDRRGPRVPVPGSPRVRGDPAAPTLSAPCESGEDGARDRDAARAALRELEARLGRVVAAVRARGRGRHLALALSAEEARLYGRLLERLGTGATVLDVGCGDGRLAIYLARHTHAQVVGLDITSGGFAQARREAQRAGVARLASCVQGDAARLSAFGDGRFGAVTMTYTLHHIADRAAALGEIGRVLAPGGLLLIGDYVRERGVPANECQRFGVAELQRLLRGAGFVRVRSESIAPGLAFLSAEKGLRYAGPHGARTAGRPGRERPAHGFLAV